jgi:D-aminopeptidase
MTGTPWLEESGFADGPVLITNTHSVGVVRDSYLGWLVKNKRRPGTNVFPGGYFTYPIVAETYDGFLNDTNGFHVKAEHVAAALEGASRGPVPEGNVGGGTENGLLWIQRRHRKFVAESVRGIYGRGAGPV